MQRPDIIAVDRLDRYRSIIPEWEAFVESLARPLPLCLWTNTLRTRPDTVARFLDREGIDAEPLDWLAGGFKGAPSAKAGQSLPFAAGLYHIQEEVSLLPVTVLAPAPGERVIDLCSAPGNKTAQIAVAMRNTGTIVANDRNARRARATRGILDRLGVVNTTITTSDASDLPDAAGRFDRVLADVPCTCEGTTRKHVDALVRTGAEVSLNLHRTQAAILRKAVQICRPGGLIAYATCTYAPEENEMVVDAMLREFNGEIALESAHIGGVVSSPGLTEWAGRPFHPSLRLAMRVWPHQNDSGGFFVALLRTKSTDEPRDVPAGKPADAFAMSNASRKRWTSLLQDRFGISADALAPYCLHQPNNKYVAAVASDHMTVHAPEPVSVGMPLIRVGLRHPKLTTAGARLLGQQATRNVVDAAPDQAGAYTDRDDFRITSEQRSALAGTGYVIVKHAGVVLGIGLYLEDHFVVKSMFPKVLSSVVSN